MSQRQTTIVIGSSAAAFIATSSGGSITCHKKSKKKTTTNSLTTNVLPTSMSNVDDYVLSRGAIIEPVAVGSRRCVEPLLHDRGDGHNHN